LIERFCDPLSLSHTRITLSDDMRRHLAQAHDINLNPTPLWNMQALQPAGAFRANVKDVTVFLKACMGIMQTPLKSSLARLLETRRQTSLAGTDVGLAGSSPRTKAKKLSGRPD